MTQDQAWKHLKAVTGPALALAPSTYLDDIRARLVANEIPDAVAEGDTPWLFNWLVGVSQFQGISDANADAFTAKHGLVGWHDIQSALDAGPACPRLQSYWDFAGCQYRKGTGSCSQPEHLSACTLPTHPARKGSLIIAAYSLALFICDVCECDLVGWIDKRLAEADPGIGGPDWVVRMGESLLGPLREIYGIGEKVWSMALADLLLAGDMERE